jgi:hydrogenase maturation protease
VADREPLRPTRRVVIGIGNPDRGADGVGRRATYLLRARVPEDVRVLESAGEATDVLEYLQTADVAYVIDAAVSGAPAGTIRRFDCAVGALPQSALQVSTHGFGPVEAIELARALGRLPRACVVYAIEADSVGAGEGLSAALQRAAEQVAARVAAELSAEQP